MLLAVGTARQKYVAYLEEEKKKEAKLITRGRMRLMS